MSSEGQGVERYRHAMRRGVLVNAAGLVAKLAAPLLVFVVTRFFGPTTAGVFLLTHLIVEIARAACIAGYADAVTIFGSRAVSDSGDTDAPRVYRIIGASLRVTLALTVSAALVALVAGDRLAAAFPEQHGLSVALRYAGLSLPAIALAQIGTAATKLHLKMEYEVFVFSFGRPASLIVASALVAASGGGLEELMLGYFVSHLCVGLAGVLSMARLFSVAEIARALLRPAPEASLHRFSLPQNLNLALNRVQGRTDVLVLGILGQSSAVIAFYMTGAMIASTLQEVRMVFSTALAPVVGRFYGAGDKATLNELLTRASRWTTSIVVPLIAVVLIWRSEILLLIDPSYGANSTFVAFLLGAVLANVSLGLGGNFLVFTGHSTYNLINSLSVTALNGGLCFLLIPNYGLLGAAAATFASALAISVAQLVELRWLEGVRLRLSGVYKPYVGLFALAALAVFLWDPASLGGPVVLVGISVAAVVLYVTVLVLLRHEEVSAYLWGRAPAASAASTKN